jgi:hypothetical protein
MIFRSSLTGLDLVNLNPNAVLLGLKVLTKQTGIPSQLKNWDPVSDNRNFSDIQTKL